MGKYKRFQNVVITSMLLLSNYCLCDDSRRKIVAPGYSVFFDGERDFFYTESKAFVNVSNVTLSAWIKVDLSRAGPDYFDSYDMHVLGHPYARGSRLSVAQRQNQIQLRVFHRTWNEMYTSDCSKSSELHGVDLNDSKWHHVAMTANNLEVKGYVDLKLVLHCSRTGTLFVDEEDTLTQSPLIHLGQNNPEKISNSRAFVGNIDEVMYIGNDATLEELKDIYYGRFPESLGEENLLIHSSFDKTLQTGSELTSEWKTTSGRSPRYEPSKALVIGGMIVSEGRTVPKNLNAPNLEISLDYSVSDKTTEGAFPMYTINLTEPYNGTFLLDKSTSIVLVDKSNPSKQIKHSHVFSGNATEEESGLTRVDFANYTIRTNSRRIFYRPQKDADGTLTLNLDFNTPKLEQNIDVIFEVLPNHIPIAGSGGHAISCDGIDDFLFAKDFKWNVGEYNDTSGTGEKVLGGGPITV